MDNIEKVEKLREKANVSYEEAKMALEATEWDVLDAMVMLEQQGKVNQPAVAAYTTKKETVREEEFYEAPKERRREAHAMLNKFAQWCKMVIHKGNQNSINIMQNGTKHMSLPVTAFVLLTIFCFWAVIPVMIFSLFFGFNYSFSGPDLGKDEINDVITKAATAADNMREEFQEKYNAHKEEEKAKKEEKATEKEN